MYLNRLFVYGTLLPGLDNYNRFIQEHQPVVYKARARGIMYYLPRDGYPVVLDGDGEIKGVLFESENLRIALPQIDEIQKYTGIESQSHLIREIRDVENIEKGETVKAHMYLWPPSKARWLKENGTVILDGDWLNFLRNQKGTSH
ncbi:gamma-glutamylcyclotransferase [Desulfallas sp. Bu1-1]|uniref:gamma-glutamylcyclotransferase family protein n=1 Tax=Desulfallas sp. Bu1-1 TaxID=2787620 RepID=UPI00189FB444|nr:gamma-glutamylcyclotransferase family protein [Desulfallas sp. Bu1-1]MBF7084436.1 gamma-glutamylcyclotransferase [Desulfallas sp. Bu1-1]